MEKRALGKGLSALIPDLPAGDGKQAEDSIAQIPVQSIDDSSIQPRTDYDEAQLDELKASIKQNGILQPILVRKRGDRYEVVAGERRLRAARSLQLPKVPVVIKDVSDQEAFLIALIENIQRQDLNPIEEAQAYQRLVTDFSYTQDMVASSVGKDRSTVANLLRLLKLPQMIQQALYDGKISIGHARTLLSVESLSDQRQLFEVVIAKGLSVRELENAIHAMKKTGARREKRTTQVNHEMVALEEDLQRTLGTKVRIQASKKRGKIVIEYYSSEDLGRIIDVIKKLY